MSYILDALKKSEKERAMGAIPSLSMDRSLRHGGSRKGWVIGVAVVLLVVAHIFTSRVLWTTSSPQPSPGSEIEGGQTSNQSQVVATEVQQVESFNPQPDRQYSETTTVRTPVAFNELDSSIQSRLPELSINALSYSANPSKRFVMINQNIFKEGEDLGNGLSIEEITRSAIIFKFEDVRFIMQP